MDNSQIIPNYMVNTSNDGKPQIFGVQTIPQIPDISKHFYTELRCMGFSLFLACKTALATISQAAHRNLDSHVGMDCFELLSDLT